MKHAKTNKNRWFSLVCLRSIGFGLAAWLGRDGMLGAEHVHFPQWLVRFVQVRSVDKAFSMSLCFSTSHLLSLVRNGS